MRAAASQPAAATCRGLTPRRLSTTRSTPAKWRQITIVRLEMCRIANIDAAPRVFTRNGATCRVPQIPRQNHIQKHGLTVLVSPPFKLFFFDASRQSKRNSDQTPKRDSSALIPASEIRSLRPILHSRAWPAHSSKASLCHFPPPPRACGKETACHRSQPHRRLP
ncbi:hypothetical protein ACP_2122 [Acidobacterium capsulatum ATCC 51196]|uniref:Uncharacterized protein n=1 Tax=Acidobacterium capsulatum (strain ATCC 51196 / DSM 11244 / BCRC 80197 / JCM 7670 / NBRC 15755 / NCIMB 13165 / 161) TaxID=240015 RepID=C1F9G5_ACIC5|nr:hypothetical protein ACP_2122 [Acidobacterium capsulatum ATCC 51196]